MVGDGTGRHFHCYHINSIRQEYKEKAFYAWRINQSDDNLICLPTMRSINPFCFDAPLSLVSKDIGAIEVN